MVSYSGVVWLGGNNVLQPPRCLFTQQRQRMHDNHEGLGGLGVSEQHRGTTLRRSPKENAPEDKKSKNNHVSLTSRDGSTAESANIR